MDKKPYSLRTNVGHFLNKANGFSRDFSIDYPEIFIEPDLNIKNLKGDIRLSRTREGLLLQAVLQGDLEATCVRCLTLHDTHVETTFEELYEFASRVVGEADLVVPEDGYIDLGVIFREYLLLEMPINVVCKPDCLGLCPECGQNLNEILCEHVQQGPVD
jgi:uncharacterized protein